MLTERNEEILKKVIRDLAGAILAGLLLLLFLNRGVLLHKDNVNFVRTSAKYTSTYELDDGYLNGIWTASDENSVTVVGQDGSVHLSLDAFETGIYVSRFAFELENQSERPLRLGVRASVLKDGSRIMDYEYTDFQPIYLGTESVRINKAHVVALDIYPIYEETDETKAEPSFRIGTLRVDNRFLLNPYVFFFGFLSVLGLALLIDFRREFRTRPAAAFCVIALFMGLSMVTALPRNKVGYDEETHLQAVMDMASFPAGELHVSDALLHQLLITEYNHPDAQPGGLTEMAEWDEKLALLADYRDGSHTPDFYTLPNRMPSYLVMAAAMKLGKGLHLSWPALLLLTRLSNLILYIAVMTLAVWLCPAGQWLMMLIGLFPINIFLACTVSYDPFVTAFISLGYALIMKGRRYVLPGLLCIFFGCLSKAVYAPVALLPLIWLGKHEEISVTKEKENGIKGIFRHKENNLESKTQSTGAKDSKGERSGRQRPVHIPEGRPVSLWHPDSQDWLLLFGCGLAFMLLAGTFILPTILAPAEAGDVRGGEAVSEVSQVGFILGHPFRYAFILIRQIILWFPQCWFGADCTTHMGHLVNGSTAFKGFYPLYLILLAGTVIVSWIEGKKHLRINSSENEIMLDAAALHIPARIWTFLMVGAAAVLVWTSMYVAFTEPGAGSIAGVQGRYFIPLMFPFYMVLSGPVKSASLERGTRLWYYLLELAALLGLSLTLWTAVISRFCL